MPIETFISWTDGMAYIHDMKDCPAISTFVPTLFSILKI